MRGLLLAGGHGTRLRPLTFTGNKHMIPIANEPMLFYGLHHLAEAGIREVAVILGPLHEGIEETVGDGRAFGLQVTYIHQGPPKGLAHAVLCAREFLANEPFVMYLGDNLLEQGAAPLVRLFEREHPDAVIGATPVANPSAYGVVELDGDRIVSIVEKPSEPKSDLALIGVYLFTPKIHPVIAELKPSKRGELEITDAIWALHESGANVRVQRVAGWWKDTGRPEDLLEANARVLASRPAERFRREGTVEPGAEVVGSVAMGPGSVIASRARVHGPVVIGSQVRIDEGSFIGPATALGDRVEVRGAHISRSIVLDGARIEGPIELHESIVGRQAQIRRASGGIARVTCILGDAAQITL